MSPIIDLTPEELQNAQATADPAELARMRQDAVAELRDIHEQRKELAKRLADREVQAVAACRGLNVSWQTIADAVEMKQPNALRKFAPLLEVEQPGPAKVSVKSRD